MKTILFDVTFKNHVINRDVMTSFFIIQLEIELVVKQFFAQLKVLSEQFTLILCNAKSLARRCRNKCKVTKRMPARN
jgi:hypothetical protein